MSWKKIDDAKTGGGGLFVKIESGKSLQMVVCGEPHSFYQIFKDKVEHENYVPGSSFRFKVNVAVLENGTFTMKIWNGGITVAKSLRKLQQKLGNDVMLEVEREGSTKDDTVYHIIPMGKVSPEQMEQIKKLKMNKLTGDGAVAATTGHGRDVEQSTPESDDDVPF